MLTLRVLVEIALKSTPGREVQHRLLLHVHGLPFLPSKETVLGLVLPVVFSSDPPRTQSAQMSSGDHINSAPDKARPMTQGNLWKTNGLGLTCSLIGWTSPICNYNKYCSHFLKGSASASTRACFSTSLSLQESSSPLLSVTLQPLPTQTLRCTIYQPQIGPGLNTTTDLPVQSWFLSQQGRKLTSACKRPRRLSPRYNAATPDVVFDVTCCPMHIYSPSCPILNNFRVLMAKEPAGNQSLALNIFCKRQVGKTWPKFDRLA